MIGTTSSSYNCYRVGAQIKVKVIMNNRTDVDLLAGVIMLKMARKTQHRAKYSPATEHKLLGPQYKHALHVL